MLKPDQIQLASMAVRELRVALSNFFLYSVENAMVKSSLDRLLQVLSQLFEEMPSIALGESEGRLVIEGSPLDERLTGSTNMIKDLFLTHKIHTLTLFKGMEASEIQALFSLLKPRSLPTGISLSQALVQQSLEHIHVNEKVFVALSEGEKVVSSQETLPDEQNLQEALEALQYFLQIFSRVRPDANKQEVSRRLMENMGAWLQPGNLPEVPAGGGVVGGEGGEKSTAPAADVKPWLELMSGFLALKGALAAMKTPAQVSEAQIGMDELLKKLVLLGESQGVRLGGEREETAGTAMAPVETAVPEAPQPPEEVAPEQEDLFEADPILAALEKGDWEILLVPALEEKLGEKIPDLQKPERAEVFEVLWKKLWEKAFLPARETRPCP